MLIRWSPLVAGWVLAWPNAATAQTFSADYALARSGIELPPGPQHVGPISFGRVRVAPALPGHGDFSGYRRSDGQALSLHHGGNRLGLSVSYDWPRYFVRLSYDAGLNPLPQDNLRFSAGMRF
jgi:hypothetical protein